MAVDLVSGREGEITNEISDSACIEILHGTAGSADQVVMVSALGQPVVQAAVFQQDPADDAQIRQQANRPEDGRPAGAPTSMDQIVNGERFLLLKDGRQNSTARRSHTVTKGFELQGDAFQFRHDT